MYHSKKSSDIDDDKKGSFTEESIFFRNFVFEEIAIKCNETVLYTFMIWYLYE